MKFTSTQLKEIFEYSKIEGKENAEITSINSLDLATENDLSFLGNSKYSPQVPSTKAGIILLPENYEGEVPSNACIFRVKNPSVELTKFCEVLEKALSPQTEMSFIHPSAVIDPTAQVDPTAHIGACCVVSANAKIGANTYLQAHNYIGFAAVIGDNCKLMARSLVMDRCVLKNNVALQAGAVIGSDGYGYEFVNGEHKKVPQIGIVLLEDNVEIGANTTIDRARFDKTIIGKGTKIDNLVQIAHNVQTGQACLIVSQVGVSGSTKIGNGCVLGGQVGVAGHLTIGDGAMIGAQSGINGNVDPKSYLRGTPAQPYMKMQKIEVLTRKLPDLFNRVKDVEKNLGINNKTFK
ncbi:MAG: UDP-3-O-(3-hydroxymyristoyl)glucosamine N-acyltransferase [Opitutales bacterium]